MDERLIVLMFLLILATFLVLIWIAFGERKGGKVNWVVSKQIARAQGLV